MVTKSDHVSLRFYDDKKNNYNVNSYFSLQPVHLVSLRRGQDLVCVTPVPTIATHGSQAPPTACVTLVTIEPTPTRRTPLAPVSLTFLWVCS